MNHQPSPTQLEAIDAALRRGAKIDAIKLWREATGADLGGAKEAVEARATTLNLKAEGSSLPKKGGCVGVLAVTLLLAGLGAVLMLSRGI